MPSIISCYSYTSFDTSCLGCPFGLGWGGSLNGVLSRVILGDRKREQRPRGKADERRRGQLVKYYYIVVGRYRSIKGLEGRRSFLQSMRLVMGFVMAKECWGARKDPAGGDGRRKSIEMEKQRASRAVHAAGALTRSLGQTETRTSPGGRRICGCPSLRKGCSWVVDDREGKQAKSKRCHK